LIKSEQARNKLLIDLEKEKNKELQAIDEARLNMQLDAAQSTADSLVTITQGLFGKQSEAAKIAFAVDKAMAIARATMSISVGIAKAAEEPFPLNLGAMATVAAATASIVQNIEAVKGYKTGGYTGDGGTSDVAGVVHGQEFVVNADATRNNRAMLEAMNKGQSIAPMVVPKFANQSGGSGTSSAPNIHIENHGTDIQVQPLTEGEIRIIARQSAQSVVRKEAPQIISSQIGYANSSVSKALGRSTQTQRRRD